MRRIGLAVGASEICILFEGGDMVNPFTLRCCRTRVMKRRPLTRVRCVFGLLSGWLSNVEQPVRVFDRARLASDPVYRQRFAALNLLHYLIDHRDARSNNFLMSKNPDDPRIYSIDNGIAARLACAETKASA